MAGGTTTLIYRFLGIDDGAGAQFDRMGTKTAELGGASSKAASALRAVGIGAAVAGATVAVASVKMAADFQTAMLRIHTQANASTAEVAKLSKGVLEMAGSVSTTPTILADAAYHIASVGQKSLTAAQQLNVLKLAAEGAKVGGSDLTDTTNALTATVVAGIKGAQNYNQAMGELNATVGAGDMKMQDLANSLSTGVTITAKQAGISLTQMGAALAVFGDNNVRGQKAGNQLRMSIQALESPAKEGISVLQGLGLSATRLATDMQQGGLPKAIEDLRQHMIAAGVTGDKIGATLTEAFGKRAGSGISTLVGEYGRFQNKLEEVRHGGSSFAGSWTAYSKSFGAALDGAKASGEALLITLGDHLLPVATKLMNWIRSTAVPAIQRFSTYLSQNHGVVVGLAAGLGVLALAVGGPVTAIAVLSTAVIAAYNHFKGFRDIVHEAVGDTLTWAKGVLASFSAWWATNGAAIEEAAKRIWTAISTVVKVNLAVIVAIAKVVLPVVAKLFRDAFKVIGDIIVVVSDLIDGHWTKATQALGKLTSDVIALITQEFRSFGSVIGHLLLTAGEDMIKGLIQGIDNMAKAAGDAALHVVTGAVDGVKHFLGIHSPSKLMAQVGRDMFLGLVDGWHGMSETIKNALSTPIQDALDHFQTVLSNQMTKAVNTVKTAQSKLAQLVSGQKSSIGSLAGSLAGGSDLSNLFGTDANGNPTVGNATSYLQVQASQLQQFAKDLKWGRTHLDQPLLQQIIALGAVQGDQVLRQFMSGASSASAANAAEATIQAASRTSASTVVNSPAEKKRLEMAGIRLAIAKETLAVLIQRERHEQKRVAHDIAVHVSFDTKGKIIVGPNESKAIIAGINKAVKSGQSKLDV